MDFVSRVLILLILSRTFFAQEENDFHFPKLLITDYAESSRIRVDEVESDIHLFCRSWRFAVEANNLMPWKRVPSECGNYVRDYMMNQYEADLEIVSIQAALYAKSIELIGDGKDVWIFDIDETLLSNLPYYVAHGFGMELFDGKEFDKWVEKGLAPGIPSSVKLYEELLQLGFQIILLTGRSENHRNVTVVNLQNSGFKTWHQLVLRGVEDRGKSATLYKSQKRSLMVNEGYRIIGNYGDQWSDLLGFPMSNRSFKLPNPMYYIS